MSLAFCFCKLIRASIPTILNMTMFSYSLLNVCKKYKLYTNKTQNIGHTVNLKITISEQYTNVLVYPNVHYQIHIIYNCPLLITHYVYIVIMQYTSI